MQVKKHAYAITALVVSATLSAGEAYSGLDANEDGYLSLDEAQSNPVLASHWEILDLNGDGQIDEPEFAQFEVINQESREETQEMPAVLDMPQ